MTPAIIADRVFVVSVKMEAPSLAALDEASKLLGDRLSAAVPGRLSGLRVLEKRCERVAPRGEGFVKIP